MFHTDTFKTNVFKVIRPCCIQVDLSFNWELRILNEKRKWNLSFQLTHNYMLALDEMTAILISLICWLSQLLQILLIENLHPVIC